MVESGDTYRHEEQASRDEAAAAEDQLMRRRQRADFARPLWKGAPLTALLDPDRMRVSIEAFLCDRSDDLYSTFTNIGGDIPGQLPPPARRQTIMEDFDTLVLDAAIWWPVPYRSRYLGLVIRQWAQEEPNAILAGKLRKDDAWKDEVSEDTALLAQWRREFPSYPIDMWIDGRIWYGDADRGLDTYLAARLRQRGLPYTPSTVRHLRAVIAGESEPLPARGLLVSTLAYVDTRGDDRGERQYSLSSSPERFFSPPHDFDIAGIGEWTTGHLMAQTYETVSEHRAFLHSYRDHPLSSLRSTRQQQALVRSNADEHGPGWFDYEAEAMLAIDQGKFDKHLGPARYNPGTEITNFLNRIGRRVKERTDTPPARGWRDRPRARLRRLIDEYNKTRITGHTQRRDL